MKTTGRQLVCNLRSKRRGACIERGDLLGAADSSNTLKPPPQRDRGDILPSGKYADDEKVM